MTAAIRLFGPSSSPDGNIQLDPAGGMGEKKKQKKKKRRKRNEKKERSVGITSAVER